MHAKKQKPQQPRAKAATADVVGTRPEFQPPPKWRRYYDHLIELRDYLLKQRDGQVKDGEEELPAFSMHQADAGTDNFDRDFALSMIASEQNSLYEIDEALDRMRQGTYGICVVTGKPIEAARLEAIPWTRFSLGAEEQLEKEGAISKTRFAPREDIVREPPTEPAE